MASHGVYSRQLYPKQSSLYSTGLRTKLRQRTRWALVNVKAIYDLGHESRREAAPSLSRTTTPEVLQYLQPHKHATPKPDSLRHHRKRFSRIRKQTITVDATAKSTDPVSPPIILPQPSEQLKVVDPFDPDTQIFDSNKRTVRRKRGQKGLHCLYLSSSSGRQVRNKHSESIRPLRKLDWRLPVRSVFDGDSDIELTTFKRLLRKLQPWKGRWSRRLYRGEKVDD
jgi:hypothetical protein